jgi:hypothetical protein
MLHLELLRTRIVDLIRRRQIGKTPLKLLPRTLQLQNNCTALIEAHQVERVLADIDADCFDTGGIN